MNFMRWRLSVKAIAWGWLLCLSQFGFAQSPPNTGWHSFATGGYPDIFVWTDTCNVYALRDHDSALLVNLGDGSCLPHLTEIGVRQIDWILLTDHHREQSQGLTKLQLTKTQIGAPEAERSLLEHPDWFRKMRPSLNDPFAVHSASYARPTIRPIHLSRGFTKADTFEWHGRTIRCEETKGNSPGGMSYILEQNGET